MILSNNNTFGIEIETVIPATSMVESAWAVGPYHIGAEIPLFEGWKTMRDGSISSGANGVSVEVVSPVLRGIEGIRNVEVMVAKLNDMGARVNQSCGFHVHVGWNGTAKQLAKLISLVSFHEKALYASTGTKGRERNSYCGSIKMRLKPVEDMTTMSDLARAHHNRYQSLNLQNLIDGRRPTVEFRVFAGTLNILKIKAYIQLCLGLVQKAMTVTSKSPWDRKINSEKAALGAAAINTLFMAMGWQKFHGRALETHSTFGMLTPEVMPQMVNMMKRMAAKYDAVA